jgi:hypothetical protein
MKMISPSNGAVDIGQTLKPHEYIGMVRCEILDAYLRDRAKVSGAEVINGLFLKMGKTERPVRLGRSEPWSSDPRRKINREVKERCRCGMKKPEGEVKKMNEK